MDQELVEGTAVSNMVTVCGGGFKINKCVLNLSTV